jgi:hypothetical protein
MTGEKQITCLHAGADGQVWYAVGDTSPQLLAGGVSDLLAANPGPIRILACQSNVPLLVSLHEQHMGRAVDVAGPQACESARELADPEIAIYRSRQLRLSPSLGGWHRFGETDYPSYKLAALRISEADALCARGDALLRGHPAMRRLRFIAGRHLPATAQLLGLMLDPRWFVDPVHPDRTARARSFLGLSHYNQRQYHAGVRSEKARRYGLVTTAWGAASPAGHIQQPGGFLHRKSIRYADKDLGELRASGLFVAYLVRAWQQGIIDKTAPWQRDPIFDPSRFLTTEELAAYQSTLVD